MPGPERRPARRAVLAVLVSAVLVVGPVVIADAASPPRAPAVERQTDPGPQLPGPDAGTGSPGAGERARQILEGDQYKHRAKAESLIDRIQNWIKAHLPKGKPGGKGMPDWVSFVIIGIVVLGAGAAAVWGLTNLRRGRRSDDEPAEEGDIEITPLRSTDGWKVEAETLEAARRWREALRARYRQLVGQLVDDHLLGDLPGRTPGEYRVELDSAVPDAAPAFDAVTEMFEAAWYGHRTTEAADVERVKELADSVRAEAGKRRRRPDAPADVAAEPIDVGMAP